MFGRPDVCDLPSAGNRPRNDWRDCGRGTWDCAAIYVAPSGGGFPALSTDGVCGMGRCAAGDGSWFRGVAGVCAATLGEHPADLATRGAAECV